MGKVKKSVVKKYKCPLRTKLLALPLDRRQTTKYQKPECIPEPWPVYRLFNFKWKKPVSKRTQNLANPKLQYLLDSRTFFGLILPSDNKKFLDKKIKNELKRIRKQMKKGEEKSKRQSKDLYLSLINSETTKHWTKQQWERHNKWLESKGAPKQDTGKKVINADLIRLTELERPKVGVDDTFKNPYMDAKQKMHYVKAAALTYNASEIIQKLAKPRKYSKQEDLESFFKVKRSALKGTPRNPDRLAEISKPRVMASDDYDMLDMDEYTDIGQVKKTALTYTTSKRIIEISTPKPQEPVENIEDAFKVKSNALKGKCLPRTIELAKPRAVITQS